MGIFCGNLVYFVVIWNILLSFGSCIMKNLATLILKLSNLNASNFSSRLPNGIFAYQKSQFGYFVRVLKWIMYIYVSMAFWNILQIFCLF
jgi:hypothetical protein